MKIGYFLVPYHGVKITYSFLVDVLSYLNSIPSLQFSFYRVSLRRGYHPVNSFLVDESNYGKSSFVTIHVPTLRSNVYSRNVHFVLRYKVSCL